jgi:hypothetical protein
MTEPPIDDRPRVVEHETIVDDDDERVSRKVIYEHSASSGSSHSSGAAILVIALVALALIAYIVMHMHH